MVEILGIFGEKEVAKRFLQELAITDLNKENNVISIESYILLDSL